MHSSLQILNQAGLNYTMETTNLRSLKTAIKRIYKTNNELFLDQYKSFPGRGDFNEAAFFCALDLLPKYTMLPKLVLKRDKTTWSLKNILQMQYTRKCKKTIIELRNDTLYIDIDLSGGTNSAETSPLPRSRAGMNFSEYRANLRFAKLVYPAHYPRR